ncbi:aspartate/glutamate racemase family protein [Verminephrobacter aporrectodeae subsp. tuberculatae]|uniref:aspartate/glutamate racemase family protein n=1 Tax=Verminephrobacter aporrectodeae TaxID=1110389 RepID=UPI00223901B1|nr:amino acid racemase [Verminephrobacter aporrectodeae]MCW5256778.1 aspartate/glutamate racemase family protein [Verminephrobacter aporrectodeae subsp. tuberculatae]MCW8197463.1 aspartate/glutamate racemase family protein [Verminephrobacter aporrectodeae subsp. tuberculatae]
MSAREQHGTQAVGILGGMGPAAGADFVRLFVQACTERMGLLGIPVHDQAYPEHWLAQVPIPDRTAALRDSRPGAHQPAEPMLQVTGRLAALGVRVLAIACNTAHAWHGLLQQRFPQLLVLHGVQEVVAELAVRKVRGVGLLATQGTYDAGLYQRALECCGIDCFVPAAHEREQLMQGIYDGVKAGNHALARERFEAVALALRQRCAVSTLIMGCTEIPLALSEHPRLEGLALLNPSAVLAAALARHAYCNACGPGAANAAPALLRTAVRPPSVPPVSASKPTP